MYEEGPIRNMRPTGSELERGVLEVAKLPCCPDVKIIVLSLQLV